MKYTSTRDFSVSVDGATAVIDGIAKDGGLYVPVEFPHIDVSELIDLDYAGRADRVLREFFDFDVKGIAKTAYTVFDGDPAPVTKLDDNLYLLELWHGKTHAYTDIPFCVLPQLLTKAKSKNGDTRTTLVLVATDGDAGKSALDGFKDVDKTEVCVFYPTDGVSRVQKLSLQTQSGDNVFAAGIAGNIDDVQAAVRSVCTNVGLRDRLAENNISVSSADTVNIGRIVPQIAFYYSAYCDLVNAGEIRSGDKIDFVIPTGNFGNVIAGWYAVKMGLPVNRLVCASNGNSVLTDFLRTGDYDANRKLIKTESPSLDVLKSGDIERLIFETSGRNAKLTAERMNELNTRGRCSVTPEEIDKIHETFACDYADDDDAADAIVQMDDEYGYLIDTHTATAYAVALRREFVRPTVVVSTVDPFKFAPAVLRALTDDRVDDTADAISMLEEESAIDAPRDLKEVFNKPLRFETVVKPDETIELIGQKYCKNKEI